MSELHLDLSGEIVGELAITFLGHIMYMREQLPLPILSIPSILQGQEKKTPKLRKLQLFYDKWILIKEEIRQMCTQYDVSAIYISIGPTLSSSREIFCLHFPFSYESTDENCSDILIKTSCRKLVRHLIENQSIQVCNIISCDRK
jgi:hypothetical protein